ncbi:MAG: hypothetical protein ACTSXF_12645 [Promethearchaeota archaeon]
MLNMINMLLLYMEHATFIPLTILVFIGLISLSIKLIGPIPDFPGTKDEHVDAVGLTYFTLIMGFWVLFQEIINIISLMQKPQYTPTYFIDSNRLFYIIMTIIICLWLISQAFLSISIWHIISYAITLSIFTAFYLFIIEVLKVEFLDFLIYSMGALIVIGIIGWIILLVGIKYLSKNDERSKLTKPLFIIEPKKIKLMLSAKIELILFALLWVLFMLSWADFRL